MGLLKKGKKKDLKIVSRGGASGLSTERPQYVEKKAPCIAECPSGNDVRRWVTLIAQRDKAQSSGDGDRVSELAGEIAVVEQEVADLNQELEALV